MYLHIAIPEPSVVSDILLELYISVCPLTLFSMTSEWSSMVSLDCSHIECVLCIYLHTGHWYSQAVLITGVHMIAEMLTSNFIANCNWSCLVAALDSGLLHVCHHIAFRLMYSELSNFRH